MLLNSSTFFTIGAQSNRKPIKLNRRPIPKQTRKLAVVDLNQRTRCECEKTFEAEDLLLVVTSFVFGSCAFVDRSFCPEN